jgi:hypothetical protein
MRSPLDAARLPGSRRVGRSSDIFAYISAAAADGDIQQSACCHDY